MYRRRRKRARAAAVHQELQELGQDKDRETVLPSTSNYSTEVQHMTPFQQFPPQVGHLVPQPYGRAVQVDPVFLQFTTRLLSDLKTKI